MAIACYAHPSMPAVADCSDCSRGLCTQCESILRPPLCADCAEKRGEVVIAGVRRRFTSFWIWGLVGGALGYWLSHLQMPREVFGYALHWPALPPHFVLWFPLALGYVFAGTVYGKRALAGRGGGRNFIMTLDLMLTIGVLMTFVGAAIGVVATPFVMMADYKLLRQQRVLAAAARRASAPPLPAKVISARLR